MHRRTGPVVELVALRRASAAERLRCHRARRFAGSSVPRAAPHDAGPRRARPGSRPAAGADGPTACRGAPAARRDVPVAVEGVRGHRPRIALRTVPPALVAVPGVQVGRETPADRSRTLSVAMPVDRTPVLVQQSEPEADQFPPRGGDARAVAPVAASAARVCSDDPAAAASSRCETSADPPDTPQGARSVEAVYGRRFLGGGAVTAGRARIWGLPRGPLSGADFWALLPEKQRDTGPTYFPGAFQSSACSG